MHAGGARCGRLINAARNVAKRRTQCSIELLRSNQIAINGCRQRLDCCGQRVEDVLGLVRAGLHDKLITGCGVPLTVKLTPDALAVEPVSVPLDTGLLLLVTGDAYRS